MRAWSSGSWKGGVRRRATACTLVVRRVGWGGRGRGAGHEDAIGQVEVKGRGVVGNGERVGEDDGGRDRGDVVGEEKYERCRRGVVSTVH